MIRPLLVCAGFAALTGCGSSSEEPLKPAQMLNPGGKPQNEKQATQASLQQQAGESAKRQMEAAARAEKAAGH